MRKVLLAALSLLIFVGSVSILQGNAYADRDRGCYFLNNPDP